MRKDRKIMELSIPVEAAADLTTQAAAAGVPTHEYLGIAALAGAYGHLHPEVVRFKNRPKARVNGPETQGGE